jgi:uncharacterized protein YjbI with pentapeptide repeats
MLAVLTVRSFHNHTRLQLANVPACAHQQCVLPKSQGSWSVGSSQKVIHDAHMLSGLADTFPAQLIRAQLIIVAQSSSAVVLSSAQLSSAQLSSAQLSSAQLSSSLLQQSAVQQC